MAPRVAIPGFTLLMSLALHGALLGGVGWLAFRSLEARPVPQGPVAPPPAERTIPVELPSFAEGTLLEERIPEPVGDAPRHAGGTTVPRVDTGKPGRGGEATVDNPAVHLSDVDERMRLSADLMSRLDRDQVQRLRTGAERASREDRRSTTNPTELIFLATGPGVRAERRAPGARDPSRGALQASPAAVLGGRPGAGELPSDEGLVRGSRSGTVRASPGVGVHDGEPGPDHRASAAVTTARPDVTQASVSVEALKRNRPADDVDSEQEVATTVRSLVHASTAGGVPSGGGVGGSAGGGEPGAGGARGVGSHPQPLGLGEGDWLDLDTNDPRLLPYFRQVHAKVDPLWANAFPHSAMVQLKQGTVILEFTIAQDGTVKVSWPPARPSGIDEFDRNCADALRRAGPFGPIPKELGVTSLHVRAPFVASNPIR